MKRVVDGVTYNTDTSTVVARAGWDEDDTDTRYDIEVTQTLYKTQGGALFLLEDKSWCEGQGRLREERNRATITPMSLEQAQGWAMRGEIEIIDSSVLGEPPEAEEEEKPGAT